MKKLLVLPLMLLLAGCVTYYYPESALEEGVYYAEDDPSYVFNSGDYSYYPWSSLDYFYLGYSPYPGYGFTYGYPFGFAYSPWDYPYGYYGYYSPRYFSYSRYPYWRPYRGNCSRHHGCYYNDNDDRYAWDDHENRRNHDGEEDGADEPRNRQNNHGRNNVPSIRHYTSAAPSGYAGNRGMVIRSREAKKIGKSRLEPTGSVPAKTTSVSPSISSAPAHPPVSSTPRVYSGSNTRSPSVSAPSGYHPSANNRSSRRKDRD